MKAAQITSAKVRNIIQGAEEAGRQVVRIEVDGVIVHLSRSDETGEDDGSPKGHGEKKWSRS